MRVSCLLFLLAALIGLLTVSTDFAVAFESNDDGWFEDNSLSSDTPTPTPTLTPTPTSTPSISPSPSDQDDGTPEWKAALILTLAAVLGFSKLFFGFRLSRAVITSSCFIVVALVTYFIVDIHSGASTDVSLPVSAGIALLAGVATFFFWTYLIPVLGALFGFIAITLFLSTPANSAFSSDGAQYGLLVPVCVIIAALSWFLKKAMLIASTSFIGSFSLIALIDYGVDSGFLRGFFGQVGKIFGTYSLFSYPVTYDSIGWEGIDDNKTKAWLLLGSFLVLAIIGLFVQILVTGRRFDPFAKADVIYNEEDAQPLVPHPSIYEDQSAAPQRSAAERRKMFEDKYGTTRSSTASSYSNI